MRIPRFATTSCANLRLRMGLPHIGLSHPHATLPRSSFPLQGRKGSRHLPTPTAAPIPGSSGRLIEAPVLYGRKTVLGLGAQTLAAPDGDQRCRGEQRFGCCANGKVDCFERVLQQLVPRTDHWSTPEALTVATSLAYRIVDLGQARSPRELVRWISDWLLIGGFRSRD
jgi:hypothetical protein